MASPRKLRRAQQFGHDEINENSFRPTLNLQIQKISPLTQNQQNTFDAFHSGKHLFLHGNAGTGKSFLALYLALNQIINSDTDYEKLVIVRSSVQSRDMGFLPGGAKDKMKDYELPYQVMINELFGRGDAYQILKTKDIVNVMSTSFLRGVTISNCTLLVDEVQNMTKHELHTVMTRVGKNCRLVMAGDIRQNDLIGKHEYSGLADVIKIVKEMDCFSFVEFGLNDIVRSQFVKSYLITRDKLEQENRVESLT